MKWHLIFVLGLLSWGVVHLTGCNFKDLIPVIGFDADGNPAQVQVPNKDYVDRLAELTTTVQDSAIPVLSSHEDSAGWQVRTLAFGIGVNAQVGIGPFKIGAYPRCRLILSNSTDPTMP